MRFTHKFQITYETIQKIKSYLPKITHALHIPINPYLYGIYTYTPINNYLIHNNIFFIVIYFYKNKNPFVEDEEDENNIKIISINKAIFSLTLSLALP